MTTHDPIPHHQADNGLHVVLHTKRFMNLNVGEIAAHSPKVAAELVEDENAEYLHRLVLKDDKVGQRAGSFIAVTPEQAKRLVRDGEAEYPARVVLKKIHEGLPVGKVITLGFDAAQKLVDAGTADLVDARPSDSRPPKAK